MYQYFFELLRQAPHGASDQRGGGDDDLLTPPETSRVLRIAVQTLAKWRVYGFGPKFVRLTGNRVFYRRSDIDGFIAANEFHSTAEADSVQRGEA